MNPDNPPQNNETSAGAPAAQVADPPRFVVPPQGSADLLKLLTELEELVEKTPRLPMGTLFRFDEDRFHMTLMKIRANLPEDLKRASKLARETERIVEETRENADRVTEGARKAALSELERSRAEAARLKEQALAEAQRLHEAAASEGQRLRDEARAEAERILEAARAEAAELVSESAILRQAEGVAEDIKMRAWQEAEKMQRGADDYAHNVLAGLESTLGKTLGQVQQGRMLLEKN
ncbi:MAG TPA: hypothetical protein VKT32_03840 [Chthonomonadaceae bacterium]|nr:hypothetical protein [Chthonomonadaceae bacterium]